MSAPTVSKRVGAFLRCSRRRRTTARSETVAAAPRNGSASEGNSWGKELTDAT